MSSTCHARGRRKQRQQTRAEAQRREPVPLANAAPLTNHKRESGGCLAPIDPISKTGPDKHED